MPRSPRCRPPRASPSPVAPSRRRITALLVSVSLLLAGDSARAEEGRFDAQVFRPSAAPRDLVMVRKSEIIGHLSPVVGLFSDVGFDPLVLVNKTTDQAINAVAARLTLTPMAGIGLWNWFDLTLAVPIVAAQYGGNLRAIGTEGPIKSTSVGDLRLSARVALPYLNRRDEVRKGFGMALAGNINLPTGSPKDFAGDGVVTGGPSIIADYRFGFGAVISANMGLWLRPDRQFAGVRVGDMASFGLGAEVYILKRWGLSAIGEVYGYPSLTKFPDSPTQIPAEFLLGGRWQSKHGISITMGGSFGAACSFGAPSFRLWSSITWQPETSREQEEINKIKEGEEGDPDHDGVIGDADVCPNVAGPPDNHGCPDEDSDGDGIPDRDDQCPDLPSAPGGARGCPAAYIKKDRIELAEEIHFADGKDIILDSSRQVLDHVAEVLIEHPEIREAQIEDRTDIHETDAYSVNLSQRRVDRVMKYLVDHRGIEPERLQAKGFGHLEPMADDTGCAGPEEKLTPQCKSATPKKGGVVIRILRRGEPPSHALTFGKAAALPWGHVLPRPVLRWGGVLPDKVLPDSHLLPDSVLPWITPGKIGGALPFRRVLPRAGTPRPEPKEPEEAPKGAAPKDAPK